MGMGRKPFMDIQPSDAAICDRAVNRVLPGRSKDPHQNLCRFYFSVRLKKNATDATKN